MKFNLKRLSLIVVIQGRQARLKKFGEFWLIIGKIYLALIKMKNKNNYNREAKPNLTKMQKINKWKANKITKLNYLTRAITILQYNPKLKIHIKVNFNQMRNQVIYQTNKYQYEIAGAINHKKQMLIWVFIWCKFNKIFLLSSNMQFLYKY